ncbi:MULTISPECIES: malonic semialdehyde reductase [unclassified Brevundimonas]|uniref:malonic semialdehyde reductase n=1 Tax=unclassified Brevundimonas TaxID=2622653 RepID=UPI003917C9C2
MEAAVAYDNSYDRSQPVTDQVLAQLFTEARTRNAWSDRPVSEDIIRQLYELTKFGPTQANTTPARFVFVTSDAGKERLIPLMAEGNQAKTRQAPVAVIIAYDVNFHETMHKLFPHAPGAKDWFPERESRREAALKNSSLQAGYLISAARALGLDVGPMTGIDFAGLKQEFFPEGDVEVNMVINLGYGTDENLFGRSPRLSFEEAVRIV